MNHNAFLLLLLLLLLLFHVHLLLDQCRFPYCSGQLLSEKPHKHEIFNVHCWPSVSSAGDGWWWMWVWCVLNFGHLNFDILHNLLIIVFLLGGSLLFTSAHFCSHIRSNPFTSVHMCSLPFTSVVQHPLI
jgi:hypothetical protein